MAKRQTRRSISVKGLTYQRLQKWCDHEGVSMSGYLENLIAYDMETKGVPEETVLEPKEPKTRHDRQVEAASGYFSF